MNVNRPIATLRDLNARDAVLRRLAEAHDRFSEAELMYRAAGQHVLAEGSHQYALIALRAYQRELDDREPAGLP